MNHSIKSTIVIALMILSVYSFVGCIQNIGTEEKNNGEITTEIQIEEQSLSIKVLNDAAELRANPMIKSMVYGIAKSGAVFHVVNTKKCNDDLLWHEVIVDGNNFWILSSDCELTKLEEKHDIEYYKDTVISLDEAVKWTSEIATIKEYFDKNISEMFMFEAENEVYIAMDYSVNDSNYVYEDISFFVPNDGSYMYYKDGEIQFDLSIDEMWLVKDVKIIGSFYMSKNVNRVNAWHPIIYNNRYIGGSKNGEFFSIENLELFQKESVHELDEIIQDDLVKLIVDGYYFDEGTIGRLSFYNENTFIGTTINTDKYYKKQSQKLAVSSDWDMKPYMPAMTSSGKYGLDIDGDGYDEKLVLQKEGEASKDWELSYNGNTYILPRVTFNEERAYTSIDRSSKIDYNASNYFMDLNGDEYLEYIVMKQNNSIQVYDFSSGKMEIVISNTIGYIEPFVAQKQLDDKYELISFFEWRKNYNFMNELIENFIEFDGKVVNFSIKSEDMTSETFYVLAQYYGANYALDHLNISVNDNESLMYLHGEASDNEALVYQITMENRKLIQNNDSQICFVNDVYIGSYFEQEFAPLSRLQIRDLYNPDNVRFTNVFPGLSMIQYTKSNQFNQTEIDQLKLDTQWYYELIASFEDRLPESLTVSTSKNCRVEKPIMIDASHYGIDIDGDGVDEIFELILESGTNKLFSYYLILKSDNEDIKIPLPNENHYEEATEVGEWGDKYLDYSMFIDLNNDGYLEYVVYYFDPIIYEFGPEARLDVYDLSNGIEKLIFTKNYGSEY